MPYKGIFSTQTIGLTKTIIFLAMSVSYGCEISTLP